MKNTFRFILKKCLFLLMILLTISMLACMDTTETTTLQTTFYDDVTIDCIMGYMWDGEQCVVDPNRIFVDSKQYYIFYEGSDYNAFKRTLLSDIGTADVINLGDYNGMTYYFSSGTHYNYYRAVKNDEILLLNEALDAEWFTLEELVNDFYIKELYSYPVE